MKINLAILAVCLTLGGILWNASAKLTRLEVAVEQLQKDSAGHALWLEKIVLRELTP